MYIPEGVLQDPFDGLQDPLLFKNYASEIGPSIGSPVGVLQDPLDGLQDPLGGLQDPLLSEHYISTIGPSIGSPVGVLQDPLDGLQDPLGGLQDPLLSEHYTSTIGRFTGSTVGVLQDPLDGLQHPLLFKTYASEIGPSIDSPVILQGVLQDPLDGLQDPLGGLQDPLDGLQDPLDGLQNPLLSERYTSTIGRFIGSTVILQGVLQDPLDGLQDPLGGLQDPLDGLQDPLDGLQDPLLSEHYTSTIGRFIGSTVGVLQDPLDGLHDPLLFKNYALEIGPSIGSPIGVLQDPLDGLHDPLLFKNYASEIGPSIGSPVGVLQDPLDGLHDPLLFKNYASEIGPSIGSPVGVLHDPLDGLQDPLGRLQDPLLSEHYISTIGPSIGSPVVCSSCVLQDPLDGLQDPLGGLQNPLDGLQDPLGGLQDPLLSEHYTSTIGRFIGSTVGVLQDPLDRLQDPLLFKNYASEIGPSISSPVVCSSYASHPPEHVEFRNPICAVVGEGETVILMFTLLFISERHNRGIRRNPSFSLEWSIVTRKHRKQLDSSSCGVFTLKFSEHVLTDNDFMFDSSKRAIRASRHIIGQVLVDNSASSSCTQDIHWLFISVSAKTCLQCQSLTSAICDDFGTMPMTITRGFSSVKGQNLATLFDVHVKHKLKEVIEMTELQGSARMSQNMNSGTRYFKDVLFVEAEILVVSHIKKITVPEADRLLHPLPSLKR
ncbi:unnamed protein product [Mytilus coruscus]|uniref:Ubiquitin-like protease family profile domain-containing protein n=1 Tax=Mytilus coruscus TaxID=42192 RepID=A0A6J8DSH9_MYTCO|nr:unnamed protein product [Mytilus coruscus]